MRYTVGDLIQYRNFNDQLVDVRVTEKHADVKNGLPGFEGTTPEGQDVWGYDRQITAVRFVRRDLVQG